MKTQTLLAFSLPLVASAAFAQYDIVYRETFSSAANNSNINLFGWGVHYGNTSATVYTNTDLSNAVAVSNLTGRVTGVDNINAGSMIITAPTGGVATNPSPGQNSTGFVFVAPQNVPFSSASPILIWTNEGANLVSTSTAHQFSFYLGNTTTASVVRVAVQVGGAWYVSANPFSTASMTGGQFAANAELKTLTFDPAADQWRSLSFSQAATNPFSTNGGGNLSLGALSTNDLSGGITAFGIYIDSGTNNSVRFDTFTITAIPEPSAFAALAGLGALGLAATRRRRR